MSRAGAHVLSCYRSESKTKLLFSSVTWGALDFTDSNLSFGDMGEELFSVWLKEH